MGNMTDTIEPTAPIDLTEYDSYSFTPTEELILETLAARYRLGELVWTFSSRHNAALDKLAAKKLIHWKHGVVDHSSLVFFTDTGKAVMLANRYRSHKGNDVTKQAKKAMKKIYKEAAHLKENIQKKSKLNK
jgi:hypothetical protein